ncbi:MAG: hypothetical protein GC190_01175 [Alphaproteobacteria bacterium]|nr:hypothetical protein [Alphaproteobacteria bacterium]
MQPDLNHLELALTRGEARAILDDAILRHFDKVRFRVPHFVRRHFGWSGAWKINRKGLGRDLYRAPLNAALVLPHAGVRLAAAGLALAGHDGSADWLRSQDLFLKTDVAREIEWLIWTELLRLPYRDGDRISTKDALAEEMLADPRLQTRLEAVRSAMQRNWNPGGYEARLSAALGVYSGNRAAAAELASIFLCLGAGAALLHQATPGVLTLGPALAKLIAQSLSAHSLPSGLAAMWLGLAPVKASLALTIGATAAVAVGSAATAAVSGALSDPIQAALGLHERRLHGLVTATELALLGDERARLVAHDHYAGRVIDLVDLVVGVWRFARA